jgi:hypothetical protein
LRKYFWTPRGIGREDYPFRDFGWSGWRLPAREAHNLEPDRAFLLAHVVVNAGKVASVRFADGKGRSIRQKIFGKAESHALVEPYDLLNVVQ